MRWLLFLSRLALICGICFLLALLLPESLISDQDLAGTLITIGLFIGMIIVPITLLCYLGVLIAKKNLTAIVPLWLVVANIMCLVLYLLYIIVINDQSHHTP